MPRQYAWDGPNAYSGSGVSGEYDPTDGGVANTTTCPQGERWDPGQGICVPIDVSTNVPQTPQETQLPGGPCPPGESREASSGLCLCPGSQCRDIGSKACREPRAGEKQNWTDDIERSTGGGRGYCRPRDPGWNGTGGVGRGTGQGQQAFGDVWSQIQALLKSPSRFTPEVMANLQGLAKQREAGQNATAGAAASTDLVRRGLYRSPVGAALAAKARVPAAEGFNKAVGDIQLAKVNADAQDKIFAVQAAMQWVQMMLQNNQFDANLQLAWARLNQELRMLQMQLSDPYRLLSGVL